MFRKIAITALVVTTAITHGVRSQTNNDGPMIEVVHNLYAPGATTYLYNVCSPNSFILVKGCEDGVGYIKVTIYPEPVELPPYKGTEHNDKIVGTWNHEQIYGLDGDDILYGENGNDHLYGGKGRDTLWGGWDDDHLYGENGNDTLWGGWGNDFLSGGNGNDRLYGGWGDDWIIGGNGNDYLDSGWGNDVMIGGPGKDTYKLGWGRNIIIADNTDKIAKQFRYIKRVNIKNLRMPSISIAGERYTLSRVNLKKYGIQVNGGYVLFQRN